VAGILKKLGRAIIPLLLVLGGVVSVYYGVQHNSQEVVEEQQIEIDLAPPMPPGPMVPPEAQPGFPGAPPFEQPPPFGDQPPFMEPPPLPGAAPFPMKVTETVLVTKEDSELKLIREVTFGGVVLLATGQLRRTYSGAPPLLCPT
jgi:hypothetical protein